MKIHLKVRNDLSVMNTKTITVRNLLEEENTVLVNTDLVQVATYVMQNLLSTLTKCSTVQLLNQYFKHMASLTAVNTVMLKMDMEANKNCYCVVQL